MIKRGSKWYTRFRFKGREVRMAVEADLKRDAQLIEQALKTALKSGDYSGLHGETRLLCIRLFRNRKWEIPDVLLEGPEQIQPDIRKELTLWKGIELCLKYPGIRDGTVRERYQQSFIHIVKYFGKEYPIKSMWVPQIREYMEHRLFQGAAGSTVNKERAALSRMFKVLMEYRHVDANPVAMVKGADESDGEREVYVSFTDFNEIVGHLPEWVQPIVRTLYFTGMRRKEALGLTWDNVNLESRIIRIAHHGTKERKKKRIPIHRVLLPVLQDLRRATLRSISSHVFLTARGKPPNPDSLRKPWDEAIEAFGGLETHLTMRDLRHVWKTNAVRSGMDFEIREMIMGHALKGKNVTGRYGRITDEDLVRAINGMRFDKGKTEIWIAGTK